MIKQVSVILRLYCLCPTELILCGMFAKFPDQILYFLCHKINWKYVVAFHSLEKTPYSQLYEFSLWKEAWLFHLFWVKRFENVFPFLLCQYDTVRKYWTAEVSERMKNSAQDCSVITVRLISTLKKLKKTQIFCDSVKIWTIFSGTVLHCAIHSIEYLHRVFWKMWQLQCKQTRNHLSLTSSKQSNNQHMPNDPSV